MNLLEVVFALVPVVYLAGIGLLVFGKPSVKLADAATWPVVIFKI